MKNFLSTAATTLIILSGNAFAVQTKHCPNFIQFKSSGFVVTPESLDSQDKDYDTILDGKKHIEDLNEIKVSAKIETRKNGRCTYFNKKQGAITLFTKNGVDYLRADEFSDKRPYHEAISAVIYAKIDSLIDGNISLIQQKGYALMISFEGRPGLHYDGGPEMRKMGFAKTVSVQ